MLIEQTIEKLYTMKLNGLADCLKEQLNNPISMSLPLKNASALWWTVNGHGKKIEK